MGVRAALACAAAVLVTAAAASGGSVIATPISSDPYTNASSQHRTQVEPDSFGYGDTVVATFQTGRFVNGGGSSNIGWATTTNAGRTWTTGMLPGTTVYQGGPWSRISDPAVAYDPLHDVWMISTLAFGMGLTPFGSPTGILVSRSTDGGLTWQQPVETFVGGFLDKNWITCDTWPLSPYYGNCYQEWDDPGAGNRLYMNRSTDGGATWSAPVSPRRAALRSRRSAGRPAQRARGRPVHDRKRDQSLSQRGRGTRTGRARPPSTTSPSTRSREISGRSALPSAEVDSEGRVYVVWQDCRFRTGCGSNDIVMSTGTNGFTWTAPVRIPIDADEQRSRPLHPGHRRRPLDLRWERPAGPRVLLLPGRRL